MSINDEFELVPKGMLRELKKEIDLLKGSKTQDGDDLGKSLALMRKSIDSMHDLFKKAAEEIKLEDRDQNVLEKKLAPLTEKIEALSEQNQKIAKALVTVSNMVQENMKKFEEHKEAPFPAPQPPKMGPPLGSPPAYGPSPAQGDFTAAPSHSMGGMPPPLERRPEDLTSSVTRGQGMMPPPPPKKKGLF